MLKLLAISKCITKQGGLFPSQPCFRFSNALNSKLLYEREIRATLSKLERACAYIGD